MNDNGETVLEIAYDYLGRIQDYLCGILPDDDLTAMLVSMLNEGIAFRLTGPLRAELDRRLTAGEIVGVIQNAWDDLNDCVMEACYEKTYFSRADALLIQQTFDHAQIASSNFGKENCSGSWQRANAQTTLTDNRELKPDSRKQQGQADGEDDGPARGTLAGAVLSAGEGSHSFEVSS